MGFWVPWEVPWRQESENQVPRPGWVGVVLEEMEALSPGRWAGSQRERARTPHRQPAQSPLILSRPGERSRFQEIQQPVALQGRGPGSPWLSPCAPSLSLAGTCLHCHLDDSPGSGPLAQHRAWSSGKGRCAGGLL